MEKKDCIFLFNSIHPNFFESSSVRGLSEGQSFDEMFLPLDEFEPSLYEKEFDDSVTFGYFSGDSDEIKAAVEKVDKEWVGFFNEKQRIYCGFIDGQIASFCLVDDMGTYELNGKMVRVGGPGCVGTVPCFRNRGIGLTMVKNVTEILKNEGYDISYIHYTGVAGWYGKLGYKTAFCWNKKGIIE